MANVRRFWKWVLGIVGFLGDPPVARIKRPHTSVHWKALIKGRLVGDILIDRPKLYLNLKQVTKEEESKTPRCFCGVPVPYRSPPSAILPKSGERKQEETMRAAIPVLGE